MTTFRRFDARAYASGLAGAPNGEPRSEGQPAGISSFSDFSNEGPAFAPPEADPLAGYVAVVRILMRRWHALGRPPLTLPRRRLSGQRQPCRPYVVHDLGRWFLDCREDLPGTRWAMRTAEELNALARELARLERATQPAPKRAAPTDERTEQTEQTGPPCADCGRATWMRCRVCLTMLPGVPIMEDD